MASGVEESNGSQAEMSSEGPAALHTWDAPRLRSIRVCDRGGNAGMA